ncbi:hypothetical protein [Gemmiger sp.]
MNKEVEIAVTLNADDANEKLDALTAKAQALADLFDGIAEKADRAAKIMPPSAVEAVTAIRHGCPPTKNFMRSISEMLRISSPEFEKLEWGIFPNSDDNTADDGSWMMLHFKNGFSSESVPISGLCRLAILSCAVNEANAILCSMKYKNHKMCPQ